MEYQVWNAYGALAADLAHRSPQDIIGVQSYYRMFGFGEEQLASRAKLNFLWETNHLVAFVGVHEISLFSLCFD